MAAQDLEMILILTNSTFSFLYKEGEDSIYEGGIKILCWWNEGAYTS